MPASLEKALTQQSGKPLTELQPLPTPQISPPSRVGKPLTKLQSQLKPGVNPQTRPKSPASISFVRNRMYYARAALNAKGGVRFGLRHIRELLLRNRNF